MNTETAVERVFALLDLRRPQDALDHLAQALAEAPDVPELHCLTALAKLQLGDAKGALRAANAAVTCGPDEEWPHRLRAIALIRLRRKREAREAALTAAQLAPDEATTHVVLATALQASGDKAGAEAAARHAVALDPDDAATHSTLGEVLLQQRRPVEAVGAFRASLALDPEDADALNNFAVARLRAHDPDGAAQQFEAAARLDPRHRVARQNILSTGAAGRSFALRRWSVTLTIVAAIIAVASIAGAVLVLAFAAALEIVRTRSLRELSAPARTLLADDRRARRLRPRRWDWSWPTRLRPWLWVLLTRLPLIVLACKISGAAVPPAAWALALCALPFTGLQVGRWLRRELG